MAHPRGSAPLQAPVWPRGSPVPLSHASSASVAVPIRQSSVPSTVSRQSSMTTMLPPTVEPAVEEGCPSREVAELAEYSRMLEKGRRTHDEEVAKARSEEMQQLSAQLAEHKESLAAIRAKIREAQEEQQSILAGAGEHNAGILYQENCMTEIDDLVLRTRDLEAAMAEPRRRLEEHTRLKAEMRDLETALAERDDDGRSDELGRLRVLLAKERDAQQADELVAAKRADETERARRRLAEQLQAVDKENDPAEELRLLKIGDTCDAAVRDYTRSLTFLRHVQRSSAAWHAEVRLGAPPEAQPEGIAGAI